MKVFQEKPPYLNKLDSLINDPSVTDKADPVLEILLTAEYLLYADKVWNGIPENQTSKLTMVYSQEKTQPSLSH